MKDFNEIKTTERKFVLSQSSFFNMLSDLDPSNRELRKLYESIIFAFIQRRMEDALLELQRCSGTQFDAQIVEVFLRAIKKFDALKGHFKP
jgi:hypothetical protein